jgi:type I restriction enzyme R subunit
MPPKAAARRKIDDLLVAAGWAVQDYKAFNPGAARGIALREVPLNSGRCDYLLLADRTPLGVIEAKKEGTTLSTVSDQSSHYGENLAGFLAALLSGSQKIPLAYESTSGYEVYCIKAETSARRRQAPAALSWSTKTCPRLPLRRSQMRPVRAALGRPHPRQRLLHQKIRQAKR